MFRRQKCIFLTLLFCIGVILILTISHFDNQTVLNYKGKLLWKIQGKKEGGYNEQDLVELSDEITVVTAYWNLGRFQKGSSNNYFDTKLYERWTRVFRYIYNPVIVYTDSNDFVKLMQTTRNSSNHRTQIFKIDRNSSWAFLNSDRIKAIYDTPGYPKHLPNTVLPGYACSQHAKYDVTARAVRQNIYKTKYFAWLDIGYFRNRQSNVDFHLIKPKNFSDSMIAMNEVLNKNPNLTPTQIFRQNIVWLGGGLFLGRHDVILRHEEQFKKAVDYFISKQLMNTDQQVLYSMYSKEGMEEIKPETRIQPYKANGDWFFLGKSMVQEHSNVTTKPRVV